MKQAVIRDKNDLRIEETHVPDISDDELLIKISCCGICGTDYTLMELGSQYKGLVPGHEACGVVVRTGSTCRNIKAGDRVCLFPASPCFDCDICNQGLNNLCIPEGSMGMGCGLDEPGAFAEYVVHHERYTMKINSNMDMACAAMIEPVSVSFRAVKHAQICQGSSVLIAGAGVIGLFAAKLSKLAGATKVDIFDINNERLRIAKKIGDITEAFLPNEVASFAEKDGKQRYDSFIDCTGSGEAINQGLKVLKPAKIAVLVGMNKSDKQIIETNSIILHEIVIKGSFAQTMEDYKACMDMVESGCLQLESFISERITLSELPKYLNTEARKQEELKIIVDFQNE